MKNTSDDYGDYLREQQRDRNIDASHENVKHLGNNTYRTTDGKKFLILDAAENHQYDIERGAVRC